MTKIFFTIFILYMISQITYYQPNFTSRNNPVKPFIMQTKKGDLFVSEISVSDLQNNRLLKKIANFFCKNFASLTNDPFWLGYKNPKNKQKVVDYYVEHHLKSGILSDDGNLTMLVVKDKLGKLVGACYSRAFDGLAGAEKTTCYIDSIAVDKNYRGCRVGEALLNYTSALNKNVFTDLFLKGEVLATGFYKKLGFEIMTEDNPAQKFAVKEIAKAGEGYPDYISFFTRPIQENVARWYEKVHP